MTTLRRATLGLALAALSASAAASPADAASYGNYVAQYYNSTKGDAATQATAKLIPVTAGSTAGGINATLVATGTNSGTAPSTTSPTSSTTATTAPSSAASSPTWPTSVWSVTRAPDVNSIYGSVTVAKIGGVEAAAFGSDAGQVDVVNVATGKELPGWPRVMAGGRGASIWSTPAIAHLDGPTAPVSIIVGAGTNQSTVGEVEAFYADGRERFVFHVGRQPHTWLGVFSSPAVGDVTGKGQPDIVFGAWDHELYALTPAGHLVPGFPYDTQDTIWSSPALYPLPGSHEDDIFIGDDASGLNGCRGGFVDDFHYTAGKPTLRWTHCEGQTIWSSPAIGVINATRRAAVVVGTGYGYPPHQAGSDELYAYYTDNGAPVPGWPVTTDGASAASPAIGYLGVGATPAVVDTAASANGTEIAAWLGTGRKLWSVHIPAGSPFSLASPILVPLLNHRSNDVLVGSRDGLAAIDGRTGEFLYGTGTALISCVATATAAVVHVPGLPPNGGWRVVVPCGSDVVAWPLPVVPLITPAWPMSHQNPEHTGVA